MRRARGFTLIEMVVAMALLGTMMLLLYSGLTFGLRGASLQWPEPARRISRWDLQGTYDNGPAHNVNSGLGSGECML